MFLIPWCLSSCGFPWSFGGFSAYFAGFLGVREVRKILDVFEVFLGIFEKTKEKKDRISYLGQCPSTVRPVFPVLVFQLGKQSNRTPTTSSTVLETLPNRTRTKKFSLEEL